VDWFHQVLLYIILCLYSRVVIIYIFLFLEYLSRSLYCWKLWWLENVNTILILSLKSQSKCDLFILMDSVLWLDD